MSTARSRIGLIALAIGLIACDATRPTSPPSDTQVTRTDANAIAVTGSSLPTLFLADKSSLVRSGTPPAAIRLGNQEYRYAWQRVAGGWQATAFIATIFSPDGKVLSTIRSNRSGMTAPTRVVFDEQQACIFDAKVPCDGPPILSGIDGGAGVSNGSGCPCTTELQDYLLAAAAFATATQVAIDTGTVLVPAVAAGLAVAGAAAAIMLIRYNDCVQTCRRLQGALPTTWTFLYALAPPTAAATCTG